MHVKKHLSFSGLRKAISRRFEQVSDIRDRSVEYSIHDCLMSAFAMMFFQDPSLLAFQRRLQEVADLNNLKTIFNIEKIPGDTQLRDTLDSIDPEFIEGAYTDFFRSLQRGKHLESYQILGDRYLIVLDGSQYFSSEKICCPGCLFKTASKGKTRYSHQILQSVLVHPGKRQVIPLAPEQINNEDGTQKQDCEINASKRVIKKIRRDHPKLKIIIGGDSLYSKQPFINELKAARMSYVLTAKPTDHKILFEWVAEFREMGEIATFQITDHKGYKHLYEWINQIPLNVSPKSENINFLEYTMIRPDGKATYHNSWVTDLEINEHNIVEMVKIGRARWKIENEGFNTLKNQGYHLEHNFGHGKKNLSYIFFLLNVLAFFAHQIFELTDIKYQKCRAKAGSRIEFWNRLRYDIRMILFRSWEHLLSVELNPPEIRAP
ncbi:hypothetical protein K8R14_05615 [bacterium]|nr:hypothetical protein [bacterium]